MALLIDVGKGMQGDDDAMVQGRYLPYFLAKAFGG